MIKKDTIRKIIVDYRFRFIAENIPQTITIPAIGVYGESGDFRGVIAGRGGMVSVGAFCFGVMTNVVNCVAVITGVTGTCVFVGILEMVVVTVGVPVAVTVTLAFEVTFEVTFAVTVAVTLGEIVWEILALPKGLLIKIVTEA